MATLLLFMNVPYDCSDRELHQWIESYGIEVESVRIIYDLVAGVTSVFGYWALKDRMISSEAVFVVDGKQMRNHSSTVKRASIAVHSLTYNFQTSVSHTPTPSNP